MLLFLIVLSQTFLSSVRAKKEMCWRVLEDRFVFISLLNPPLFQFLWDEVLPSIRGRLMAVLDGGDSQEG